MIIMAYTDFVGTLHTLYPHPPYETHCFVKCVQSLLVTAFLVPGVLPPKLKTFTRLSARVHTNGSVIHFVCTVTETETNEVHERGENVFHTVSLAWKLCPHAVCMCGSPITGESLGYTCDDVGQTTSCVALNLLSDDDIMTLS